MIKRLLSLLLFFSVSAHAVIFNYGVTLHSDMDDNRSYVLKWNNGLSVSIHLVNGYGVNTRINYSDYSYSSAHTYTPKFWIAENFAPYTYVYSVGGALTSIPQSPLENLYNQSYPDVSFSASGGDIYVPATGGPYSVMQHVYIHSAHDPHDPPDDGSPHPVVDLYTYSITLNNTATNYYIDSSAWLYWDRGLPDLLYDQDSITTYSVSGSHEVERDQGLPVPDRVHVILYNSFFNTTGQIDYSFNEVGSTPSGGVHYDMTYFQSFETAPGVPTDPENPPMPIDPTDPPVVTNTVPPSYPTPGGNTSPSVDPDYAAFRDAVESALQHRELSSEQIGNAMRQALIDQKLSNTNLKDAFAAALAQMGVTEAKNKNAFQNALAAQGLKASNMAANNANYMAKVLDDRNLNADAIGQSVADKMNGTNGNAGVISKLDEISDKLSGSSLGELSTNSVDWTLGTNTVDTGMEATASNMVGKSNGLIDFIEEWFGHFFVLDLPTSIGQQTMFILEIPDGAPGVGSIFPAQVVVDLSSFHGLGVVRGIEVACLHLFGVFCAVRIYKSCW